MLRKTCHDNSFENFFIVQSRNVITTTPEDLVANDDHSVAINDIPKIEHPEKIDARGFRPSTRIEDFLVTAQSFACCAGTFLRTLRTVMHL